MKIQNSQAQRQIVQNEKQRNKSVRKQYDSERARLHNASTPDVNVCQTNIVGLIIWREPSQMLLYDKRIIHTIRIKWNFVFVLRKWWNSLRPSSVWRLDLFFVLKFQWCRTYCDSNSSPANQNRIQTKDPLIEFKRSFVKRGEFAWCKQFSHCK